MSLEKRDAPEEAPQNSCSFPSLPAPLAEKDSSYASTDSFGDSFIIRFPALSSGLVLLMGTVIVAFLTRYNLQPSTVWSSSDHSAIKMSRVWEEYLVVNITGLIFLPFLLILCLFRATAADFGFRAPDRGYGKMTALFFVAMLPVLYIASRQPAFQVQYPIQGQAAYNWNYLLYFELTYGFYLFCWEYFYRGFLTLGLERGFGEIPAILLQATAFGVMHWGKPIPEFISSFFGGAILGWLALRVRSFLPGFWLHWGIAITLDLLAIHARVGGLF